MTVSRSSIAYVRGLTLVAVAVLALSHRSDGQQPAPLEEQLKLASVMPRGAMIYIQTRDLAALMRRWTSSPIREAFYKSDSYTAFSQSRVFLKLQDRRKDFETALGFGMDESRLADLAGGVTALSVYDIGKMELVFVSQMPRERALATVLLKQARQFQERPAGNAVYYVRDVSTDGGRLNQQFCFSYAGDKLIVATTEGLMIRALANAGGSGSDSMKDDVMTMARRASGFNAHDVTVWMDQKRLNQNRYFNSYWIHHNAGDGGSDALGGIEGGIVDMEITGRGLSELRWFQLEKAAEAGSESLKGEQVGGLLRFADAGGQLAEVRPFKPGSEEIGAAVSRVLLGEALAESPRPENIPDRTRNSSGSYDQPSVERYSRLDSRFDRDIDDDQTLGQSSATGQGDHAKSSPAPRIDLDLAGKIAPLLERSSPAAYCEIVRSTVDPTRPFVKFERAVVIETGSPGAVDRASIERAVEDAVRSKFVVSGVDPHLVWEQDGALRFISQTLLEQGVCYAVTGKFLVFGSSKEFVRDLVGTTASRVSRPEIAGSVNYYAVIRVAAAKPVFDKLMGKLDGKTDAAAPARSDSEEEGSREIKFFSENLSSLIAASSIREIRLVRGTEGALMTERVQYLW
jgi:hypothetical protein